MTRQQNAMAQTLSAFFDPGPLAASRALDRILYDCYLLGSKMLRNADHWKRLPRSPEYHIVVVDRSLNVGRR